MGAGASRDERFMGARSSGRNTGELMRLISRSQSAADVMDSIGENVTALTFSQRLTGLMRERGMNTSRLVEQSLMSKSFVYQLCSGERKPSRDMVLRLALLLKAGTEETQRLLCSADRGALYPKNRRDALIIYALKERLDVQTADELLCSYGEEPLLKI